ncbi:MAG: alpha/beta fold hydrolase, partial [Halobacteriaceae archaeon]
MSTRQTGTVSLGEFTFACGQSIPDLQVAYETYGTYEGDNVVLLCHALTGSQRVISDNEDETDQAVGWWDNIVGPNQYIDTNEYFVVCANVPGSCYGTSGPVEQGPDGEPWALDFPPVTVGDWTRSQRLLLDHLGIDTLHAVIGGSVGGMNVLEWAKRYPEDVN